MAVIIGCAIATSYPVWDELKEVEPREENEDDGFWKDIRKEMKEKAEGGHEEWL